MKLKQLLESPPLPDDWDKSKFKRSTSFKDRLNYALDRAKKMGTGSSRVAFLIEYEGRKTILKIAKNKKGIHQNDFESQMFDDSYVEQLNITIPMIDYDEENNQPVWIHTEYAEKMTPNKFKSFFNGFDHHEIHLGVNYMVGKSRIHLDDEKIKAYNELYEENDAFNNLIDLVGNFDIPSGDFERLSNWGIYQNKPVIIDLGLSTDILHNLYS